MMSESLKSAQPSANSSYDYLFLPGELRNLISKQILVSGEVWIRPPPLSNRATLHTSDKICLWLAFLLDIFATCLYRLIRKMSDSTLFAGWLENRVSVRTLPVSRLVNKRPCAAYQFLATCKQVHDEGRAMFYSKTWFHLPPGPAENTETWIRSLQPEDKAVLDLIVLDVSGMDVEPHIVDIIYIKAILKSLIPFSRPMPGIWIDDIENHLVDLWTKKAAFLERWQEENGATSTVSNDEVLAAGWKIRRAIRRRLQRMGLQDIRHCLIQREYCVIGGFHHKVRL